jgi:nucleotide-binding universal stress UspA family protein
MWLSIAMTTPDARPVVVAYDGSVEAQAAVRTAATLFTGRTVRVVTVWEPNLAQAMMSPDLTGASYIPPDPKNVVLVEDAQRDHATDTANSGAELARSHGATAEPLAVPDEADIAGTIAALADRCDACAVVVGSRGLGGIKSRLLGSTSHGLLEHADRPILVVRAPRAPDQS